MHDADCSFYNHTGNPDLQKIMNLLGERSKVSSTNYFMSRIPWHHVYCRI